MPRSDCFGSSSSSTHSATRRVKRMNYRRVGPTSYVDETLFSKNTRRRNKQLSARLPTSELMNKYDKKQEVVTVCSRDMVRHLVVPRQEPTESQVIVSKNDYRRVVRLARHFSKAEKDAIRAKEQAEAEARYEASERRRRILKEFDQIREAKYDTQNDLDREREASMKQLRSNAERYQLEQDDDIKFLNKVMSNARVQAMRDAQIEEKRQIKKEQAEEELKLDLMVEIERQNGIRLQEEIDRKRMDERLIGAAALIEQIKEIDKARLESIEERDYDNRQMQHFMEKQLEEDQRNMEREKKAKLSFRADLHKANSELLARKEIRKQQEKLEDLKVVAFQTAKAEREAALEREQLRIRRERERESARLCAAEKRDRCEANEREALRAKRAQDDWEREWRRKEAEAQRQKAQQREDMLDAYDQQMAIKRQHLANELTRAHKEFDKEKAIRQEQMAQEHQLYMDRRQATKDTSDYILMQIRQKERAKVMERALNLQEGVLMDQEKRIHRMSVETIKQQKLQELREAGVPEKYLSVCERLANRPQHSVI